MKKMFSFALMTLVLSGCATMGSEAAVETDLAGMYTLTTMIQGMSVNGQMRITGEPGAYDGAIYTDFTGELPMSSVNADGNHATIIVESPDGPVEIQLTFEGESFTGEWALGGETGNVRGRRVSR